MPHDLSLSFEQARQYAEDRLERELSPDFVYHGILHTRREVVPAAETLAHIEGIPEESRLLLLTAAWFHDIDFTKQSIDYESISIKIAENALPFFGYTEEQVEIIRRAIQATALPRSPASLLEQILSDADLDTSGSENFMDRNGDLRRELTLLGNEFTDEEWYSGQLKFLQRHRYFTSSARLSRHTQKTRNINELKRRLEFSTRGK